MEAIIDVRRTKDYAAVYAMHAEYLEWDFEKFSCRLAGIQKIIKKNIGRASDDEAAFDKFVENNPVSIHSHKGYIQWKGSDAQKLVKKDIDNGVLATYTKENYKFPKMEYWLTRKEFNVEFPLQVFCDKIRQEICTKKYLHTMKKKKPTYNYNWGKKS